MKFPSPSGDPAQQMVTRHVAEGRYPGAQLVIARHGKRALARTVGDARLDPRRVAATDDTLWLLSSSTDPVGNAVHVAID